MIQFYKKGNLKMGLIKDFQLQIDHLKQQLEWAVSKIMSQPTYISDLHRRLNDTNKALDAVNARLDGDISLRLKAQSAHTLAHQTRLDVIEEQIDEYYDVEHPEATKGKKSKGKKPLYSDWEYDANGMIIDTIDAADQGC
jgi:hypothetical protein